MQYMVRFAHGKRAAIGFHDIPVDDGELVQTREELGTPRSHGCIRQWRPDARALWRFAPVGTTATMVGYGATMRNAGGMVEYETEFFMLGKDKDFKAAGELEDLTGSGEDELEPFNPDEDDWQSLGGE